jgi:hypothetical protein
LFKAGEISKFYGSGFLSHMLVVGVVVSYMATGTLDLINKAKSIYAVDGPAEEIYGKFLREYLGANLVLGYTKFVPHYGKARFLSSAYS